MLSPLRKAPILHDRLMIDTSSSGPHGQGEWPSRAGGRPRCSVVGSWISGSIVLGSKSTKISSVERERGVGDLPRGGYEDQ